MSGVSNTMKKPRLIRFDRRVLDEVVDSKLPTVGGITARLGCTPNQVARSLVRLRDGGYVLRDPDKGLSVWKVKDDDAEDS